MIAAAATWVVLLSMTAQLRDVDRSLLTAAERGETAQLKALLSEGANVHAVGDDDWSALALAAENGHTEAVLALLAAGAYVNAKTKHGWTALMVATNHVDTVRALVAAGANSGAKDGSRLDSINPGSLERSYRERGCPR